ncbi:MAG: hypothetical protein HC932_04090 [Thermales bacterium]|nr:hypothetical protein [Thermales bacterium]
MKQTERKVFLCGGLTGGPIIPLLAVSKNIPYQPIIIGCQQIVFEKKNSAKKRGFISFCNYL